MTNERHELDCCAAGTPLPRRSRAWSRRELLALLARSAGAALAAPPLLDLVCRQAFAQAAQASAQRSGKKLILLWMDGGPSQIDTFDPKPGAPTNGPFKALATDVPGCSMSEHLPQLSKCAPHLSMIRSLTSKEGTHARARELLHSGYTPNASVAYPSLGSIAAHEIGDLDSDLPAFVQIAGKPVGSGFLGIE